jgi:hypothetical protein
MRIKLAVLALFMLVSQLAIGQATPSEITNADVISMAKAGIGDQTIILAIQRGPVKFDTSPQALIALKSGGVSDQVLNEMLASVNSKGQMSLEAQIVDARIVFQKALDAIGPHEMVMAVHSIRWKGVSSERSQSGGGSFEREVVKIYPDKAYTSVEGSAGQSQTQVVTPDFNYRTTGNMTTAVPPADLDALRDQFEFDTLQVAQHAEDYAVSSVGMEQVGGIAAVKLEISKSGKSIIWEIDPQTGRLLSTRLTTPSGDLLTEYSDWRIVDGVYLGFKRHVTQPERTSDLTIAEYEINPAIDEKLFQRPAQAPSQGLTLKILQAQSVPYTQQSGGGISTSCSIVGSANTSAYANTLGNSTYGNATTSSDQHMNCNSYDTTVQWPHVLNVMFAEASDGNSYMFACDRAWRWSKCVPLRVGQVFNARFTNKGLEVEAFNTKGKEENPTYQILQSKSLH